jgi:hypothetical protein
MRPTLCLIIAICAAIIPCQGQRTTHTKPNAEALLAEFIANTAGSLHACRQLLSDPTAMQNPKVQAEFLNLLDRQTQEIEASYRKAQQPDYVDDGDEDGDGAGDNGCGYFDILNSVGSVTDWSDPRQVSILVAAGSNPDFPFAAQIAAHWKTTIQCLIKMSASDADVMRAMYIATLIRALAASNGELDPSTVRTADQVIQRAIGDRSEAVRLRVATAIGSFAGKDMAPMIPALEKAANSDIGHNGRFFVREAATEAIAAIEKANNP